MIGMAGFEDALHPMTQATSLRRLLESDHPAPLGQVLASPFVLSDGNGFELAIPTGARIRLEAERLLVRGRRLRSTIGSLTVDAESVSVNLPRRSRRISLAAHVSIGRRSFEPVPGPHELSDRWGHLQVAALNVNISDESSSIELSEARFCAPLPCPKSQRTDPPAQFYFRRMSSELGVPGEPGRFDFVEGSIRCGAETLLMGTGSFEAIAPGEAAQRFVFFSESLNGTIVGCGVEAFGTTRLEAELDSTGAVSAVSFSNPSTLALSRGSRLLAVTDGSFRLHRQAEGGFVLDVDGLKASLRDDDDSLVLELGRVSLHQHPDDSATLSFTGASFRGQFSGLQLDGIDVMGVELRFDAEGRATRLASTGGNLCIDDGSNQLVGHDLSIEVTLSLSRHFDRIDVRAGLAQFDLDRFGMLTCVGLARFDLEYHRERLIAVELDVEQLTWAQPDSSQLDARNAIGRLEHHDPIRRAVLESGALAWRGASGLEITCFGLGARLESDETLRSVEGAAGLEGMTVQSPSGWIQLDHGTVHSSHTHDRARSQSVLYGSRATVQAGAGVFELHDATIDLHPHDGRTQRMDAQAATLQYVHGSTVTQLERARLVFDRRNDAGAHLQADAQSGAVSTDELEFTLGCDTRFEANFAADGLLDWSADVSAATGEGPWGKLSMGPGHFRGSRCGPRLSSFSARGEVEITTDAGARLSSIDGEVTVVAAQPDQVHWLWGDVRVRSATSECALTAMDVLLGFDSDGELVQAQLLNPGSTLRGSFGTVRSETHAASVLLSDGRIIGASSAIGVMHLNLSCGLQVSLERARSSIVYRSEHEATITIEDGRGLLAGEFGRLTLPGGFRLRARRKAEQVVLDGATPNTWIRQGGDLRAVNALMLRMECDPDGFRHLWARGRARIEHCQHRLELCDGALNIDYQRKHRRLVYRGDRTAVRFLDEPGGVRSSADAGPDALLVCEPDRSAIKL